MYFETPGTLLGEWRELTLFCNQDCRSLMQALHCQKKKKKVESRTQGLFLVPIFWAITLIIPIQTSDALQGICKEAGKKNTVLKKTSVEYFPEVDNARSMQITSWIPC